MIISRYMSRQLFGATIGVSSVLVIVLVCGQFVRFLGEVAAGKLGSDVVFLVMAYRMPEVLQLVLPLGLFLGVLLSYGRMYLDNEMVVLESSGISQTQFTRLTMIPALCMALTIGFFSFYLTPKGLAASETIMEDQKRRSGLEMMSPGRFHVSKNSDMVTYMEKLTNAGDGMENLFIARQKRGNSDEVVLINARHGYYRGGDGEGARYLVLTDGYQHEGQPGKANYTRTAFDTYGIKLKDPQPIKNNRDYEIKTTQQLWDDNSVLAKAEFQWRLSIALLVPIIVLMAVPLSKVNPRQGRYLKLLPSIMLHLAYLSLLMATKNALEKGRIPAEVGMLWVHVPFLLLGIVLNSWSDLRLKLFTKSQPQVV